MNDERRCLIIDRQPAIRLGVRGLLEERYEVEEAIDGREALGLITSVSDFDVAVVELGATGDDALSGLKAIRALRKARPGLGIVAHPAYPVRHGANEAIGAGATAYVAKSPRPPISSAASMRRPRARRSSIRRRSRTGAGVRSRAASARSCSCTPTVSPPSTRPSASG